MIYRYMRMDAYITLDERYLAKTNNNNNNNNRIQKQ